jgi:hypothetical protein
MLPPVCLFSPYGGGPRTVYGRSPNGQIIHIDAAPRGAGNLVCPDCGIALIARKGDVRVPHFSHASGDECRTAGETVLHLMAKEIISGGALLHLPAAEVEGLDGVEVIHSASQITFDTVDVEVWENGLRPDLIGVATFTRGRSVITRRLIIEIRVTHAVDARKRAILKKRGDSVLEIDLSKVDRDITRDDLAALLVKDAPRRWIYHERIEQREIEISVARRAQEAAQVARRSFAISMSNREDKERTQARNTPPSPLSPQDRQWAEAEHRRWRLIDHDWMIAASGDDEIFDATPVAWRVLALSIISPWRKPAEDIPFDQDVRPIAVRAGKELREREWVKQVFAKPLTQYALGKKRPWDPVADAVEDYIEEALLVQGYASSQGERGVRLYDAHRDMRDAWREHELCVRAVLNLYRASNLRGYILTLAGKPPLSEHEAEDLIAEAAGLHSNKTSHLFFDQIARVITGKADKTTPMLCEKVLTAKGIGLSLKGDRGPGATARAVAHLEANQ